MIKVLAQRAGGSGPPMVLGGAAHLWLGCRVRFSCKTEIATTPAGLPSVVRQCEHSIIIQSVIACWVDSSQICSWIDIFRYWLYKSKTVYFTSLVKFALLNALVSSPDLEQYYVTAVIYCIFLIACSRDTAQTGLVSPSTRGC